MVRLTRKFFKHGLKALLFLILVVFYYVIYMRHALEQFNEKRTTMAESLKQAKELEYPILVFCPEPGFKPSFLKKMKWNLPGTEKFIWKYAGYYTLWQNVSSIPDVYGNMSYNLGQDWIIQLIPFPELTKR